MDVDFDVVKEFAGLALRRPTRHFSIVRPRWNSDIRWIGPRTEVAYRCFEDAFRRLGIAERVAPMLDLDREVRLYAGFLVTRKRCTLPDFHVDWRDTARQAYTMMTPVGIEGHGFGLLYRDDSGRVRDYDYRTGEALFFSDDFLHSTKPGAAQEDVVLLCFTFGTDRMRYWEQIKATSGSQSALMRRPDGEFERVSLWRSWRRHLGWLAYRAGLR